MFYRKNTGSQYLTFVLTTAAGNTAITGATPTIVRSIDGAAQAAVTGAITELGGGQYQLALSAADTNGNDIGYLITASTAKPQVIAITTTAADPSDSVRFGLTALPNAAAAASGGLLINGSNTGTVTLAALSVTGAVTFGAAFGVTGTTTLNALTVSNATTLTGAVSLGSTLAVTGATTFAAVSTSGTLTLNALTVSNATTLTGAVSLGAALAIAGTLSANAVSVATTTTLTGAVSLGSTLAVTGTTTLAAVTASGTLTVNAFTVSNATTLSGAVSFGSTWGVTGAVTWGSTAAITGGITTAITGNVTGNLSGSVGSVSGAVASVTGNVGGNVTGSVGSVLGAVASVTAVSAGAITTSSFAAGAVNRAALGADTGLQPIRSGTAQAGATGSITLDSGASATNQYYKYATVLLTGGTAAGQYAFITDYNGTTKVATITPAWRTNPDVTTTFAVLASGISDVEACLGTALNGDANAGMFPVDVLAVNNDTDAASGLSTAGVGYAANGYFPANVTRISGDSTAADNAESFFDGTGYAGTGNVIPTVTTVSGAVGSVTGAVGSVTGNVGGNVTGNVTGSVGSVVGAVGSVTALGAGSITAATIADGAIDRAAFAADTGLQSIRSNTAQSGGATSITLDSSASSTTDFYKGATVYVTGGTGVGQSRLITAYNGTSKLATVSPAWATNPDVTSTFAVVADAGVDVELWGATAVTGMPMPTYSQPTGFLAATFPTTVASTTNITAGTITTATNLTNAPTVGDFTATMKTSIGTAVAASAVASVTGNVGGNVGGNVTGSVGSVVGAVGSVTGNLGGNVGGNVTGSVGSVAANGIAAASIATGAITAAKFAANALDATWDAATRTLTAGTNIQLPANGLANVTAWTTNITGNITGNLSGSVGSVTGDVGGDVVGTTGGLAATPDGVRVAKGVALTGFPFPMFLTGTNTPATGKTVSATRSLDGGAFAACANAVTEVSGGWYKINLATTDTDGGTIAFSFTASGCDTTNVAVITEGG
jgi:hypothetical protein